MEHEPNTFTQTTKPCSTPHSAPVEWLEEVTRPYLPRENKPASTPEMVKPPTRIRHDGWSGECMAIFCETLAETAVVAEACEAANKHISGAYALRRRNPYFAAAWDAALTIARERLADTLLARSMEGNIEQIWKDGEIVGERHLLDNRLGLAILRRLDRLAETGMSVSTRGERFLPSQTSPAPRLPPMDWQLAISALRTGDEAAVCEALALFKGHEVDEVEASPGHSLGASGGGCSPAASDEEPEEIDLSHRFRSGYRDGERTWFTDFPPPAGFTGYESCDWGDPDETYERECTPEERAVLDADAKRARDSERAGEEALRLQWLELLKSELVELADKPVERLGNSLVDAEGEAVEKPADNAAP
jgi:hypothetical protein